MEVVETSPEELLAALDTACKETLGMTAQEFLDLYAPATSRTILQRCALEYLPEPLSSGNNGRSTARDFGALYAHVLNSTITHDKIQTLPVERDDWRNSQWIVAAVGENKVPRAFPLTDGSWLFAAQTVGSRKAALTDRRGSRRSNTRTNGKRPKRTARGSFAGATDGKTLTASRSRVN